MYIAQFDTNGILTALSGLWFIYHLAYSATCSVQRADGSDQPGDRVQRSAAGLQRAGPVPHRRQSAYLHSEGWTLLWRMATQVS